MMEILLSNFLVEYHILKHELWLYVLYQPSSVLFLGERGKDHDNLYHLQILQDVLVE